MIIPAWASEVGTGLRWAGSVATTATALSLAETGCSEGVAVASGAAVGTAVLVSAGPVAVGSVAAGPVAAGSWVGPAAVPQATNSTTTKIIATTNAPLPSDTPALIQTSPLKIIN